MIRKKIDFIYLKINKSYFGMDLCRSDKVLKYWEMDWCWNLNIFSNRYNSTSPFVYSWSFLGDMRFCFNVFYFWFKILDSIWVSLEELLVAKMKEMMPFSHFRTKTILKPEKPFENGNHFIVNFMYWRSYFSYNNRWWHPLDWRTIFQIWFFKLNYPSWLYYQLVGYW